MNDVSRRNFVALAGAGVALGACGGESATASGAVRKASVEALDAFLAENKLTKHGLDPHYNPNNQTAPKPDDFKPTHIVVAHIESRAAWHMKSNHAHYSLDSLPENKPETRLAFAIDILKKKLNPEKETSTNKRPVKFKNITSPPVFDKGSGDYADYDGLKHLGFNSKHEIFVFFESPKIVLTANRLIYFSQILSDGVTKGLPNDSFLNGRIVHPDEMERIEKNHVVKKLGKLIRLENHLIDEKGATLKDQKERMYSLNFIYQAPGSDADGYIPMFIDPDTGNGMGNNP